MCEPIPISEFVEQITDAFRQFFEGLEDLFREVAKMAEEIKKALDARPRRPRTSHKRHRPARIREGYPWLWVVPHS